MIKLNSFFHCRVERLDERQKETANGQGKRLNAKPLLKKLCNFKIDYMMKTGRKGRRSIGLGSKVGDGQTDTHKKTQTFF